MTKANRTSFIVNSDSGDESPTFLCWSMLSVLGLAVAFFSFVHHFYPGILNVPENQALPFSSFAEKLTKDLGIILFAVLIFLHSLRVHGFFNSTMFFMGSFIFTGLQESIWILLGRFGVVAPTYYFTKGIFWFFETPVSACIGWYCLAYSLTWVSGYLLPGRTIVARGALAGFLAMNFDLWGDPGKAARVLGKISDYADWRRRMEAAGE